MKIDFLATQTQFLDHMFPIARALGDHLGTFYITPNLKNSISTDDQYIKIIERRNDVAFWIPPSEGCNPVLFSASGDVEKWYNGERGIRRPKIMMEHGVGITFPQQSYAGGRGIRDKIDLFLAPNEHIRQKTAGTYPNKKQAVIGTPKLDEWFRAFKNYEPDFSKKPTIAISFHWNCSLVPEAGNALRYFKTTLQQLARNPNFHIVGHGHPRIQNELLEVFSNANIPFISSFEEVMGFADLLVNDCSSILYEFCVTGKPVLIMNAPWFRKEVKYGIRFWDYTDIGPQVDLREDLEEKIMEAWREQERYRFARRNMISDLYPFLGWSAEEAARAIIKHFG